MPEMVQLESFSISGCDALVSLIGMQQLPPLKSLNIENLAELTATTGVSDLSEGAQMRIEALPMLNSLAGFQGVTSLGVFSIVDCANLNNLAGLQDLQRVTDELRIDNCETMMDVSALSGINDVTTAVVSITHNQLLSQCDVLDLVSSWHSVSLTVGFNGSCE